MYFFVTSGMSYRNYCDSNVFECYFSRELFPDASLALSEGSWGRLPSLCVPYHNLRSSWLFLVSNISCISKRFLYREIRPSRFGRFSGKLRPSPHYAGGIWKRKFSSENASNVFRPHYAGGIWKRNNHRTFCICVWGKLGQGNHVIIVTSSFSKSSVLKVFPVHTKTKTRHFRRNFSSLRGVFEKMD